MSEKVWQGHSIRCYAEFAIWGKQYLAPVRMLDTEEDGRVFSESSLMSYDGEMLVVRVVRSVWMESSMSSSHFILFFATALPSTPLPCMTQ